MTRFRYRALSTAGELVSGEAEGADGDAVIAMLNDQSLLPIDAAEVVQDKPSRFTFTLRRPGPLPGRDLALFSQQLARLLSSSLPLDRALDILTRLAGTPRSHQAVSRALELVRDGASLSEAMAAQHDAFPGTYVSMVRAGEAGGALQPVLSRLADFLVRSEVIRQKVSTAMVYPAILLIVAVGSVSLVLTVVLPQFAPMFEEAGARLPGSTRIVMAMGDALRNYWWAGILGLLIFTVAWQRMMANRAIAARRDAVLLRLPVLRDLVTKIEIGRFCRSLGVLLANGVPAPRALALCGDAVGNRAIGQAIEVVSAEFKEGAGLAAPLERTGRFPDLAIQLIRIGEETGRMEELLTQVADIYDGEVERLLDRLLALLVPAITITMGVAIAGIIAAVMTAMISINDLAA